MNDAGPPLEQWLRRLSETPPEFYDPQALPPTILDRGADGALVAESDPGDPLPLACDLLRDLIPNEPPELDAEFLAQLRKVDAPLRKLRAVFWLLRDPWVSSRPDVAPAVRRLLVGRMLLDRARHVRPEEWVHDPDRREELARVCLDGLNSRPHGESENEARDRLAALDTLERVRVLRATAAAEKRAREIREAMARQAALDAASRYGE